MGRKREKTGVGELERQLLPKSHWGMGGEMGQLLNQTFGTEKMTKIAIMTPTYKNDDGRVLGTKDRRKERQGRWFDFHTEKICKKYKNFWILIKL